MLLLLLLLPQVLNSAPQLARLPLPQLEAALASQDWAPLQPLLTQADHIMSSCPVLYNQDLWVKNRLIMAACV